MRRDYFRWWSPALQRDMDLLVFGHSGARVIVFPTSMGKFYEWEDRGMMEAMRWPIEQGWFQFFCVDSVDRESWYNYGAHPGYRAYRQMQYERYVLDEVIPLSWGLNQTPFLITTGASFGAYHAVTMALRWPQVFQRTLGMSGIYDISRWVRGYQDTNVYGNNPVQFIPNEHDPWRLEQLRRLDIIITVGEHDPHIEHNRHFSGQLWGKGIWNALRVWDGWAHDWPWWTQMLRMYIGGAD